MFEFLLDKALEFLVSTIGPAAFDSWRNSNNVDSYLSELHAAVPKAHLLIERAECWRLPKYKLIDENLPLLKDSVYEAQSIVLELQYQSLKHKVERRFPHTQIFQNWMSNFPNAVKIVLDRLNNVYYQMKEICDNLGIPENPNQFSPTARPITSTFLDTSNLYGRDKEFNEVIRLMGVPSSGSSKRKREERESVLSLDIGESSCRMDKKHNVSVLSIVGMGGVGKTTLSQMVCNDETVKSYFDPIMWVCVSENFDLVKLTKEIIECATKKVCDVTNLNEMQKALQKELNSKKFLLVLDDVWRKDWQRVLTPMQGAPEGSVVLVTTRSPECVEISGTGLGFGGVINLEGLEEDIYWEFFKSCAFDSVESNNINPELEDIGKEICKRLKGSPLAAITIGGALKNISGVEHWRNIKDSKMWELQKGEHDILPVLQLSYQYLPSYLKKCFSFCSLYPKDYEFTQDELTNFWIMHGFIDPKESRTQANGYFDGLVRRGFFQKGATQWVIHDLMHDVCQAITKDECFFLENGHSEQKVSPDIRHASVFQYNVDLKELYKYKKLLSLNLDECSDDKLGITEMEALCDVLENIQSLSLARCHITELPENIGNLKHLQFLDISDTFVKTLPESICNLYNLQYLNMIYCSDIKLFPKEFNNLVNLERFECIAKVIHTNNLKVILKGNKKIEILKNLCKLSGVLYIGNLECVPSKEAAQKAQLNNRPINLLELEWSGDCNVGDYGENSNEVLDGLCPHHNLEELAINGYPGSCLSPSWLKEGFLPNLTEVRFDNCKASTISHLPRCITKLVVDRCLQLENLQNLLVPNHLPNLKYINFFSCPNLKSLSVESFGQFESLQVLSIIGCPKLRSPNAMVLPSSVKHLALEDCGDLVKSSPSFLQNLTSLKTLTIMHSQHLVSIPAEVTSNLKNLSELYLESCNNLELLGGLQNLNSLSMLHLEFCDKLQSLEGLQNLKSLSKLYLLACRELQSLGGVQFLASLREVNIRLCRKLGQDTIIQYLNGELPSEPIEEWKRSIST